MMMTPATPHTHTGRGGRRSGLIPHAFIEWTVIVRRDWTGGTLLSSVVAVVIRFVHEARFEQGSTTNTPLLGFSSRRSTAAATTTPDAAAGAMTQIVKIKVGCRVRKVEYERVGHFLFFVIVVILLLLCRLNLPSRYLLPVAVFCGGRRVQ